MNHLHRKIILRLLAAWLVISTVLGIGFLAYNTYSLDQQLLAKAALDAEQISRDKQDLLQAYAQQGSLHTLASEFLRRHYLVVRLYDTERRLLTEETNPRHADLIDSLPPALVPGDRPMQRVFSRGADKVLQVSTPLHSPSGAVAGYAYGALLIDRETVDALRREALLTLAGILAIVLVTSLALYPVIVMLNRDLMKASRDLLKGNLELMEVLGSAVAQRDSETGCHNYRVTLYAISLAETFGLTKMAMQNLIVGSLLHDVGKIGIRDDILLKPGKLTAEEFAIMQTHVSRGALILSKSSWLQRAREVVEFHHEKFDGSGYLQGRKGDEIPLNARIFTVVDVFDALTSRRPYKDALSPETAMEFLQQGTGEHFDPRMVKNFLPLARQLYLDVGSASPEELEARLALQAGRYFFSAYT